MVDGKIGRNVGQEGLRLPIWVTEACIDGMLLIWVAIRTLSKKWLSWDANVDRNDRPALDRLKPCEQAYGRV